MNLPPPNTWGEYYDVHSSIVKHRISLNVLAAEEGYVIEVGGRLYAGSTVEECVALIVKHLVIGAIK